MHHFAMKNGVMHAEDVDLATLAAEVGTPFYCYSTATLTRHYKVFNSAFSGLPHLICYAVKANSNLAVLKTLARLGAGMDVVSGGELRRALAASVAPEKIIFSGVGKTEAEMAFALENEILCFNVELEPELNSLSQLAQRKTGSPARRSGSIPMLMPKPMPRSPPARRRTNSASRFVAPAKSMRKRQPCRG